MPRKKRTWIVLGAGFLTVCGLAAMQGPLRQWVSVKATLANPSPLAEQVEEVIRNSTDGEGTIIAAWNTGKIVQREVAARQIAESARFTGKLPENLEAITLQGCLDPDLNVRETCLATLQARKDPAYAAMTLAQLKDCDPQVRLLGLQHLPHVGEEIGIPAAATALDDNDPEVAVTALRLLGRWTGQEFGARLRDVLASKDPESETAKAPDGGLARLRMGLDLAKQWWAQHQAQYPSKNPPVPCEILNNIPAVPAGNFALEDLNGRKTRLTDYRGKIVVINFWTTWCTACAGELPKLIQLENQNKGDVTVLGISLDTLPNDDGDQAPTNSLNEIKGKVARMVKSKNINYPVLLDVHDEAGGQYNGGELPTTVIVDAKGNIRRRFIGARNLQTFNAMIAEAGRLLPDEKSIALQ